MGDDVIEQTLYICREVQVYRIPPRPGAGGWRSGEWRVGDKIFSGRLRVVSRDTLVEIRLEDLQSGELFAVCPIPWGKREVAVEPVTDSSRYFVLRVEDPATKRHAFLGLGFSERGEAFDFSAALSDHEKHVRREREVAIASTHPQAQAGGGGQELLGVEEAVQTLYKHHGDLGLKEGQTIRINVKSPTGRSVGGPSSDSKAVPALLPPPPGSSARVLPVLAPPPSTKHSASQASPLSPGLVQSSGPVVQPLPASLSSIPSAPASTVVATSEEDWATFD